LFVARQIATNGAPPDRSSSGFVLRLRQRLDQMAEVAVSRQMFADILSLIS
jgi:hypothetical protein